MIAFNMIIIRKEIRIQALRRRLYILKIKADEGEMGVREIRLLRYIYIVSVCNFHGDKNIIYNREKITN